MRHQTAFGQKPVRVDGPQGRFTDAEDYRAKFPDGRIGSDPSLADPKDGEKLVALSAAGLTEDYGKFLAG